MTDNGNQPSDDGNRPTDDRNRTTVRRALRGGGVVGVVVFGLALAFTASADIPLRAIVATGIAAGLFITAGWLLLSMLLDNIAGQPPDRRRTIWTVAMTVLAMLAPFLLLSTFIEPGAAAR